MPEDTPPAFTLEGTAKRGPGRPKGATTKTAPTATAVNADVRQALATLESMYKVVGLGLMMVGPATAVEWMEQTEKLKETNEDALKAAPKLAKWIANTGTAGGAATFLLAHGMAFASVAGVARGELREKAQERAANRPEQQETSQFAENRDPTLIPGM